MPALAATMSTMASTAPTSWKWIFSMSTLWILASEAPRSSKVWMAVCFDCGGEVGGVDERRGCTVRERPWCVLVAMSS